LLKRLGLGLLFGVGGYIAGAIASYFLIRQFSTNMHDRSVEAAMTSAFFIGPVAAVLGFVGGMVAGRRRPAKSGEDA